MEQDLSKQQEGMERIGLMAASLYGAMVREGVPADVAERLTASTLHKTIELSMQQAKQQGADLIQQLIMRAGRA